MIRMQRILDTTVSDKMVCATDLAVALLTEKNNMDELPLDSI